MKKLLVALAIIVFLLVVAGLGIQAYGLYILKMVKRMEVEPWTHTVDLAHGLLVDSPIPLARKETIPPGGVIRMIVSHEGKQGVLSVFLNNYTLGSENPVTLDGAVEKMEGVYERQGMKLEDVRKWERSLPGGRAMEVEAVTHQLKVQMRFRAIYFYHGTEFCQVKMLAPLKGLDTAKVWERMKGSIREGRTAAPVLSDEAHAPIRQVPAAAEMPPWMKRRTDSLK